jgi:hypothetical protein
MGYIWLAVAGLLLPVATFLLLRASAYRIDRPQTDRARFGVPYFWNWKYWNKKYYFEEGHRWLRMFQLCTIALWICVFIGLVLIG